MYLMGRAPDEGKCTMGPLYSERMEKWGCRKRMNDSGKWKCLNWFWMRNVFKEEIKKEESSFQIHGTCHTAWATVVCSCHTAWPTVVCSCHTKLGEGSYERIQRAKALAFQTFQPRFDPWKPSKKLNMVTHISNPSTSAYWSIYPFYLDNKREMLQDIWSYNDILRLIIQLTVVSFFCFICFALLLFFGYQGPWKYTAGGRQLVCNELTQNSLMRSPTWKRPWGHWL